MPSFCLTTQLGCTSMVCHRKARSGWEGELGSMGDSDMISALNNRCRPSGSKQWAEPGANDESIDSHRQGKSQVQNPKETESEIDQGWGYNVDLRSIQETEPETSAPTAQLWQGLGWNGSPESTHRAEGSSKWGQSGPLRPLCVLKALRWWMAFIKWF